MQSAVIVPANRARRGLMAVAALAFLATATVPAPAAAQRAPDSFADLAEKLSPAVVNISTTSTPKAQGQGPQGGEEGAPAPRRRAPQQQPGQRGDQQSPFPPGSPFDEFFKDFFERGPNPTPRRVASLGSGFIIDAAKGYVITNNHVIDGADEIKVTLHNNKTLTAKLVGKDERADVAVLQVPADKELVALNWGNSDTMRVGDWVVAVGNPFGLGGSVTAGIVSARARGLPGAAYDDFIQTDASINKGNSGGPLVNLKGEVIGINTAIYSPTGGSVGIGFAQSTTIVKPVVDQIIQYGKAKRGWLGVRVQSIQDDMTESLGLKQTRGALVASVQPNSPAAAAGIQPRDVITEFDGKDVTDNARLPRLVAAAQIDKSVAVKVLRDGKEKTIQVKVAEMPADIDVADANEREGKPAPAKNAEPIEQLGLSVASLTPELRRQYQLSEQSNGVVITSVKSGSAAEEKGMRPGDVLVEVDQGQVASPKDVQARIEQARQSGKKSVLMLRERGGDQGYIAVPLAAKAKG
ncbi:DegQ family serine endoprotease [Roseiterribacter gracilis]|uniref:Probable periplasmic serine endoprotease DegP-like n=1 Tax=Roseiterribacter gracilis TaxID=2812848 RepID=A0A8S8XGK2_9PROT|nr:serine protease [Rhodospirillales bacterium TMPK1]